MAEKHDEWVRTALGVDPAAYEPPGSGDSAPGATSSQGIRPEVRQNAVPPRIDPASLPPGPLSPTDYAIVGTRNKYLAGLYDPNSLIDRAFNVVTGSMHDPANVLTEAERAEHVALGEKIAETLNPPPTSDEARLDALENSPIGAIGFAAVSLAGGSQAKQDLALGIGAAVEGVALSVSGARAGPVTEFLGTQTGRSIRVEHPEPDEAQALLPNLDAEPTPTAEELVKSLAGHGNARHGSQTSIADQTTRVLTDRAPDGTNSPTDRATRFDSPEAELDAVTRALAEAKAREYAGLVSQTIAVSPKGVCRLPRMRLLVSGFPGGYGSGVQIQHGPPGSSPIAVPTGQDMSAIVILERNPMTGGWKCVSQYPTNLSKIP